MHKMEFLKVTDLGSDELHVIVLPCTWAIWLICMPEPEGCRPRVRAYISGKP